MRDSAFISKVIVCIMDQYSIITNMIRMKIIDLKIVNLYRLICYSSFLPSNTKTLPLESTNLSPTCSFPASTNPHLLHKTDAQRLS